MSTRLDPHIDDEFDDPPEDAEAYDAWFRKEVQLAIGEDAPSIPHDEAVAWMREQIEVRRKARNAR